MRATEMMSWAVGGKGHGMGTMRALLLLLGAVGLATPASGQVEELHLAEYCTFDGTRMDGSIYTFGSTAVARQALARVTSHTGLEPNFDIRAGNVRNAMAVIDRAGNRLIVYNQRFMTRCATRRERIGGPLASSPTRLATTFKATR